LLPGRPGLWFARAAAWLAGVALLVGASGWGALAIYYSDLASTGLRTALAVLFAILGLATLVLLGWRRWRWRALGAFTLVFVALLAWWSGIAPSNDRDWKPEVAVLPYATIDGDRVTMHNIRNFDYRSETDFTARYYDKTFDLRKLESVDLVASYWAGPAIAHIFLSFGFGPSDYLAISIERRDQRGEGYSAIKGMFKQYELFYVVADERDVIRVRTNYRRDPPERVYLYRLQGSPDSARRVFEEYLREINALRERPQFYHTVTANCTGNIWLHARINPGHVPYSWKVLVSGHLPEYLYEQGRLDARMSFAELQRRGHINALAQAADPAPDFSRRIRAALALPATETTR
jgi:hypothetical protein